MNTESIKLIDDSRPINIELTNLNRRVIPWTIVGFIITLIMGAHTIIFIKSYYFDGNNSGMKQENILFFILMLSVATMFGISLIYTGAKLRFNIKNMLVANVEITNISFEGWNFFYKGRCQIIENGKKRAVEAPMYFGDVSGIRKTKKAKLYYVSDKVCLLMKLDDNIIESQLKSFSAYKQKENLIAMNGIQKEAVLHKIYSEACKEIFKAITIPLGTGLLIFIILSVANNSSSARTADIAISVFVAMLVFLDFIEPFVKYISMLIIVGRLKKSSLLWTVLPVTQCTRSINIFERWYRYAHYYYRDKMHKDWMMIGRNQIDRVVCIVSDEDKEKPYGFLYGWFKGVLY